VAQGLGLLNEATQNRDLRFSLGLIDFIDDQPLWHVSTQVMGSPLYADHTDEAAEQSIVLLRNIFTTINHGAGGASGGFTLPLSPVYQLAVLGSHVNAPTASSAQKDSATLEAPRPPATPWGFDLYYHALF